MSEFVKIVRLPPMKVLSLHLKGESLGNPEEEVSEKKGHILAKGELVGLFGRR